MAAHVTGQLAHERTRIGPERAGDRGQSSGAQLPQQRVVAQRQPAARGTPPRVEPPVPVLVPIIRSTITTCRARQAAASSSCWSSASASAQTSAYDDRSCAAVRSESRISSSSPCGEPLADEDRQNASHRVGSSSRRASRCLLVVGQPAEPVDVRRVLGAGEELQLAELHGLEAAGRRQPLAELQEVLRRHRLEHVDLLDQHPLDDVHAVEQVLGPPQLAVVASPRGRRSPRAGAAGTTARRPGGW